MQATDRKQAYIDWVLGISKDEIVNVYEYEDVSCDNPIGTEVYNTGKNILMILLRGVITWKKMDMKSSLNLGN